jgi:hypothetical protein
MIIGCSILDDTGESDYQPLYIAARMGALGGPIAALFCVLIAAALSQEALDNPTEPIEAIRLMRKVEGVRTGWIIITVSSFPPPPPQKKKRCFFHLFISNPGNPKYTELLIFLFFSSKTKSLI